MSDLRSLDTIQLRLRRIVAAARAEELQAAGRWAEARRWWEVTVKMIDDEIARPVAARGQGPASRR